MATRVPHGHAGLEAYLRKIPPHCQIIGAAGLTGIAFALATRPTTKIYATRYDTVGMNPGMSDLDAYWQSVFTYHNTTDEDFSQIHALAKTRAVETTHNLALIQTELSALLDDLSHEVNNFPSANQVKLGRIAAMALHFRLHSHPVVFRLCFHLAGGRLGRVGRGSTRAWLWVRAKVGYPGAPSAHPKTADKYKEAIYGIYKALMSK